MLLMSDHPDAESHLPGMAKTATLWTSSLIVLWVLTLATVAGFWHLNPPAVVPASAPAAEFSAERALVHLKVISQQPHPVGSAAHAEVRIYLTQALTQLGLAPEIQESTVTVGGQQIRTIQISNILARIKGQRSSPAVLLCAHYDSVPGSYGASDDGAAVSAMLETIRALQAGPSLQNDVMLLISDAEECGFHGARAFVNSHPWADQVGLVLNFEARGHTGPSFMFETSSANGWLIREFARATPYPQASSLTGAIYKRLPNDTDLTVFKRNDRPYSGLNFSFIHGLTHYHSPLDNIEHLNPRSLQHHGSYMLSLTRHFGNLELSNIKAPDRIYFVVPLLGMVHYPGSWALPLALVCVCAFMGLVAFGINVGTLSVRGMVLGLLPFCLCLVLGPGLSFLGWHFLKQVLPERYWINHIFAHGVPVLFLFGALNVIVMVGLYGLFKRWTTVINLAVAPLLAWLGLAVTCAFALPGGSYLFTWPVLFALIATACGMVVKGVLKRVVVLSLLAVPIIILAAPWIRLLEVAMTIEMLPVCMSLLVLLLTLLVLQIDIICGSRRRGTKGAGL